MTRRWVGRPRAAPMLLGLIMLSVESAPSQRTEQSASDLIRLLTDESARPERGLANVVFDCPAVTAEYRFDKPLAEALVRMGDAAVPDLEAALDTVERQGGQSDFALNSEWLMAAYARIQGRAAFPRLARMLANPRLAFFRPGLSQAVALSLGITSYVPDFGEPGGVAVCGGVVEPEDVLDRLIRAWEKGDQRWVEGSLGPGAEPALKALLKGNTWQSVRTRLWSAKPTGSVSVGYFFTTHGWWSVSPDDRAKLPDRNPTSPTIEAD